MKAAVIVAGGSGKRMGSALPKQFLPLAERPILIRTLEAFWHFQEEMLIALVLPAADKAYWSQVSHTYLSSTQQAQLKLCDGGNSRCQSVFNGLQKIYPQVQDPQACWVAIHDGVRPFVSPELLEDAFQTALTKGASVACMPVKSSLRSVDPEGHSQTVDRSLYYEVQTPQTFRLDRIYQAFLQRPHDNFTDDASLYQEAGHDIAHCMGSYDNIKITTPEDLELGELILKRLQKEE